MAKLFYGTKNLKSILNLSASEYHDLIGHDVRPGGKGNPWDSAYYRGTVYKRAGMSAAIPRRIMKGGQEVDELPFKMDIADLIWRCSVALDRFGGAYGGIVDSVGGMPSRVRWFDPDTIELNYRKGPLLVFDRRIGGKIIASYEYEPETETAAAEDAGFWWVWAPGMQEIGPGTPLEDGAKSPAVLLNASDKLSLSYVENGAIAGHFITAEHNPPDPEKSRVQALLNRVFGRGIESANSIEVFPSGMNIQKIGTSPNEWDLSSMDAGNMTDVSAVMDTPAMLLNPDVGANRALLDRVTSNWVNYTILPHTQRIVDAFNHHILEPAGYTIELNAQGLTIEQEEEKQRALAWSQYVLRGADPDTVATMLGLDIPEGMEFMMETPIIDEPDTVESAEPDSEPEEEVDDTKSVRWNVEMRQLQKFIENGSHKTRPFTSDVLSLPEIEGFMAQRGVLIDYPFSIENGY